MPPLKRTLGCTLLLLTLGAQEAYARIKLITLPVRDRVEVQLQHPNTTLIEEERTVPLIQGRNEIDFAWANTHIDPSTIVFRVVKHSNPSMKTNILSVSYPPNEAALTWAVSANQAGAATIRISYVINNLSKHYHYRARIDQAEKIMVLSQFMRVKNDANEGFEDSFVSIEGGQRFSLPLDINATQEVLVTRYPALPVKKLYLINPEQYGYEDRAQDKLKVPMFYQLDNTEQAGLGKMPLAAGKVRLFQEDGHGTVAFLGEDRATYTALGDDMKLRVGQAKDIVVKRTIERKKRKRVEGNLYDYDITVKYSIENFKNQAVTLQIEESPQALRNEVRHSYRAVQWSISPKTTFLKGLDKTETSQDKLVFHVALPAKDGTAKAKKIEHKLNLIIKNEW